MAADGRVDWRWRTGGDVIGMPVADERYVYFVSLDNVLRALNMVSGGQQWMRPLPMRPTWGPVKAGATIVVAGQARAAARVQHQGRRSRRARSPAWRRSRRPSRRPSTGRRRPTPPRRSCRSRPTRDVAAAPHVLEHPLTHMPLRAAAVQGHREGRVGDAGRRTASSRRWSPRWRRCRTWFRSRRSRRPRRRRGRDRSARGRPPRRAATRSPGRA